MATVLRSPLIQPHHRHPAHRLPAIFQPVNILCATVSVATAIALPLKNASAMVWEQVQHPSRAGYLNPDTSKGTPKTLRPELTLPSGNNRLLHSVSTPAPILVVVDTSKSSFRGLLSESVPRGTNRLLEDISTPAPIRSVVDTSTGSYRSLFPSPFIVAPHIAPLRFWFQPEDSSSGMAKVRYSDATPPFRQNTWNNTPEPVRRVSDTSSGTNTALFNVPLPFVAPQHYAPQWWWFQSSGIVQNVTINLVVNDAIVATPEPLRGGGGGPRKYMHWSPSRTQPYQKKELKKLLLEVAETDSKAAKQELEDTARHARDAMQMAQDVQQIIHELSGLIDSNARQLEITHQWAQKMVRRIEDERIILLLLLESD